MKAKCLEDLQIWQRACEFAASVFAVTRASPFDRDARLREQLNDCVDSIVANIAEGFGQSSDRAFARYLTIAKGSALEAKAHLVVALGRRHITEEAYAQMSQAATEVVKMLAGFIRYLSQCDWKNRV